MTTELEKYYNKFCEDKRLTRRHGQVEYITSMKYIHEYLGDNKDAKILDVGAGTGRYSVKLVAYCMNEYSILTYGFKENHIRESIENGKVSEDFHVLSESKDLYDYVRVEDIDKVREEAGLERIKLISADGPANYMRSILNSMDDETFKLFIDYHLCTCERPELLGAGAHTLDILRKL